MIFSIVLIFYPNNLLIITGTDVAGLQRKEERACNRPDL